MEDVILRKRQKKLTEKRLDLLMKEREATPFKPKLQSKSIERIFLQNGKDFYSRMRDYSRNKKEKRENLENELTRQQCTFRPNLSKSSRSIKQLRRLEQKRKLSQNRREEERRSVSRSRSRTPGRVSRGKQDKKQKFKSRSRSQRKQKRNTRKELLKQLKTSHERDFSDENEELCYEREGHRQRGDFDQRLNQSNMSSRQNRKQRQEGWNQPYSNKKKRNNQRKRQAYIGESSEYDSFDHRKRSNKGLKKAESVFKGFDNTEHADYSFIQKVSEFQGHSVVNILYVGNK
jgi:hypothetical protein